MPVDKTRLAIVDAPPPAEWGTINDVQVVAPGILRITGSGHGGIGLSAERNERIPACQRAEDGWYEEDLAAALPAVVFSDEFGAWVKGLGRDPSAYSAAVRRAVRDSMPDAWEAFTGEKLGPGESAARDQADFIEAHKFDWTIRTSFGFSENAHDRLGVPRGMVGVLCYQTGHADRYGSPRELRAFLVTRQEWDALSLNGLIIDPARAQPLPNQHVLGFGSSLAAGYQRLEDIELPNGRIGQLWCWTPDEDTLQLRVVSRAGDGIDLVRTASRDEWARLVAEPYGNDEEVRIWQLAGLAAQLAGRVPSAHVGQSQLELEGPSP